MERSTNQQHFGLMNNIILLLGGAGLRMAQYSPPKPFLKIGEEFLYEIALKSAQKFLPLSTTYAILSPAISEYVEINSLRIQVDNLLILKSPTQGPAETARILDIPNENPIYIVDCDIYFEISDPLEVEVFDCKLFYFPSNNTGHSFLLEEDNRVVRVAEKNKISTNGIVGIYGFRNKTYYNHIYDQTDFTGEKYISTLFQTAIKANDYVLSQKCKNHLPFGTPIEYEMNAALFLSRNQNGL
jgi:hypothetical protein